MKIEAFTVCSGYSDFLSETIKTNKGLFDSWLIVTTPQDEATRNLCRKHSLKTLVTGDAKETFNKGRLIERGLQLSSADAWRLHLDADMALPHDFRQRLVAAHLQQDTIYGCDRLMISSFEDWQTLLKSDWYLHGGQYGWHCRVGLPEASSLGSRWAHPDFGYVPIGFFQLWHSSQDEWKGVRVKPYPQNHGNACRTDVQHGLQWDREKRALIPELVAVHLESGKNAKGVNWNGRTTPQFGPLSPITGALSGLSRSG